MGLKILYDIPNPNGLGADRWIYMGWKDAFLDFGHEVHELTLYDNFQQKALEVKPEIFMTSISMFDFDNDPAIYKEMRKNGTKIFLEMIWHLIVHGHFIVGND